MVEFSILKLSGIIIGTMKVEKPSLSKLILKDGSYFYLSSWSYIASIISFQILSWGTYGSAKPGESTILHWMF